MLTTIVIGRDGGSINCQDVAGPRKLYYRFVLPVEQHPKGFLSTATPHYWSAVVGAVYELVRHLSGQEIGRVAVDLALYLLADPRRRSRCFANQFCIYRF